MSKIQLTRLTQTANARHTAIAKLGPDYEDQELRIVYRGMSLAESIEFQTRFEGMAAGEALPQALAEQVIELPDVNDQDRAVEPNEDFFRALDTYVLHRIANAIQADRTGNPI